MVLDFVLSSLDMELGFLFLPPAALTAPAPRSTDFFHSLRAHS